MSSRGVIQIGIHQAKITLCSALEVNFKARKARLLIFRKLKRILRLLNLANNFRWMGTVCKKIALEIFVELSCCYLTGPSWSRSCWRFEVFSVGNLFDGMFLPPRLVIIDKTYFFKAGIMDLQRWNRITQQLFCSFLFNIVDKYRRWV